MGIANLYATKETLGTDRLVDAAACYHLHTKGKRPGIVIDMGTATTIDYITEKGEFLGGAIAPGLVSAYRGLLAFAPELPEVGISKVESPIGTTTKDCIRIGVIAGHAAMAQALSSMMARAGGGDPLVVYTGGLAEVVEAWMPGEYIRDEHLTLKGLSIIYRINMKSC
jgi:type III pantothenate kinase